MQQRRLLRALLGVAAMAVTALAVPGGAAKADPLGIIAGETLDVTAQKLDVDVDKGTAVLEGDVHAILGDLEVVCPKVEIRYDRAPRVRWAKGTGGVVAKLKGIEARAASVQVDVASRRVELSGGVRLSRGRGWLKAGRATIDIKTHKVSLEDVTGSIPVETPAR